MSKQYPGGLITKNPVAPAGPYQSSSASGVWTLAEQAYWKKQNLWPTPGLLPGEPYFNYVTMLLHGNGANGAQNNTFVDSSTNNFSITRNGNTTQGTFTPYGANWSNYFDGSGDYLSVTGSALNASTTTDYTVEFWMYTAKTASTQMIYELGTGATNDLQIYISTTALVFQVDGNTPTATVSFTDNSWVHVACVKASGTLTTYINGVGTTVDTGVTVTSKTTAYIGMRAGTSLPFTGYLSNMRVTRAAVYTSNFTPSTTPLTAIANTALLTCQSNRFIDNSASPLTITVNGNTSVQRFSPFAPTEAYSTSVNGGSGYFDGNGDYLQTTPLSSAFTFGTGDFTLSVWIYPTTVSGIQSIIDLRTSSNLSAPVLYLNGAVLTAAKNDQINVLSGGTVVANAWNFTELTRTSGSWRLFINGTLVAGPVTDAINYTASQLATIGIVGINGTYPFSGFMTDVRILKGTGGTTSTVPTVPLTAITNTQLLTNFTNAGILDNAMMNDLETVGNAQISTSVKKYGTGSMYFDGNGDYLQSRLSNPFLFGTASFTIEMWVNPSTTNHQSACFFTQEHISASNTPISICIYLNGGNYEVVGNGLGWGIYSGGAWQVSRFSLATIPINTWTFIALVRNGNIFTMYVNGTSVGSVTYSGSCSVGSTPYFIGRRWDIYGSYPYFNGYIDDFRLTVGYARYTSNFTPPTSQFLDQ